MKPRCRRVLAIALALLASHAVRAHAARGLDGSRLTRLLRRSFSQAQVSGIQSLTPAGGTLFFTTSGKTAALWKSNGRANTAHAVPGVKFPVDPTGFYEFLGSGDRLFFNRQTVFDGSRELWVTNGRSNGTHRLFGQTAGNLIDVGGVVFFTSFDYDGVRFVYTLFKTDGTAKGTVEVKQIASTMAPASAPGEFTSIGGRLFFDTADERGDTRLNVSDGTGPGTLDLGSGGFPMVDLGGVAISSSGGGLWTSDGTPAGTRSLVDLGGATVNPSCFGRAGSVVFFAVRTLAGEALWLSDGTAGGTRLVADGQGGARFSQLLVGTAVGETFYFVANDPIYGASLWRSDGTDAGTIRLEGPGPGTASDPQWLVAFDDLLYFTAPDSRAARRLWRTDGTSAGTVQVTNRSTLGSDLTPVHLTVFGDRLVFTLADSDGSRGLELWALRSPRRR